MIARYRVEWYEGRDHQFYVRLVNSNNGKTLAGSEGYSSAWGARRGAKRMATAFGNAEVVDAR